MPTITVNPTSYNTNTDTVTVNYVSDVVITNVKLTKDNTIYIDSTSFSQTSATFDIGSWEDMEYTTCKLKCEYVEENINVTSVSLNKTNHTFSTLNDTVQLTATVSPSNATNKNVTWSSSNTSIATVSNGLVTSKANGSATITVTTADGNKTATCSISVNAIINVPVTSVSLNKTSHTFTTLDDTTQLTPTISPSNATNKNVTWSSSNSSVATVSNGLVTSKANGSATITVTTQDGNKTATCSVSVSAVINVPVTSVSLDKNTLSLNVGETETLTATVLPSNATNKNVTWTSSNTNVATVSNGLVTAKANGNCTITCTTQDGNKTATCSTTVNSIPVENYVTLSPTDYEISNDTLTVYYTTNVTAKGVKLNIDGSTSNFPYTATSFTQTSATFNLSSVSNGSYNIRIQVEYGDEDPDPTVNVASVSLDRNNVILEKGSTVQLTPTVLPSNATNKNVSWNSSNTSIASVSPNGLVTAKEEGTCTITCTSTDGSNKTATCSVSVSASSGEDDNKYIATLSRTDIGTTTGYPTIPHRSNFKIDSVYIGVNGGDFTLKSSTTSDTESSFDLSSLSLANKTVHTFRLKFNHSQGSVISEEGTIYVDLGGSGILPITSFNVTLTKPSIMMGEKSKIVTEILPKGATPISIGYSTENAHLLNVDAHGECLGILPGNVEIKCTAICGGQTIEQTKNITVTQAHQESPVSGNITTTVKDYKAIVSNGSTTRKYDVSYINHYMLPNNKILTTEDGDDCYLCLHENATSPFIIDGKRPFDGGWNETPSINIYTGYAGQVNSLSYSMKNINVPSELMSKALKIVNSALPEINLSIDNNSNNTIAWEHLSDTYLGATWSRIGRFEIILNARTLVDSNSKPALSTTVHEIGHTFGFTDQLTHIPTMYHYNRDRNKCIYYQPNDIFSIKLAYGDLVNNKSISNKANEDVIANFTPTVKFDFEYFETEDDKYEASDLVAECVFVGKEDKDVYTYESTLELRYNLYNFKILKVVKGVLVEDTIKVKVHESFNLELSKDEEYKLYLCEYENIPYSLINIEQGIQKLPKSSGIRR